MYYKKLLSLALIAIPAFLFAQKEITVTEGEKAMSLGTKNGYVTVIPQAKLKDVVEDWKKLIRKDSKAKVEENAGELKIMGAVNKNISSFPVNIFSKIMETPDGIQLSAWVSEGEIFVSTTTTPDKSLAVQKFLHDFAAQQYRDGVKTELEGEQKKAKEIDKVYEGFVNAEKKAIDNITDYNKEIEKLQGKIKEAQMAIDKAKADQVPARANADKQKEVVNQATTKMNAVK